jgi:signal transduction histidine kinase
VKNRSQDRALWTAVVVMVVVLFTLAFLQYRWSKRVADATEARINASLKASVMDWHLSLLREIAEPCFAIQVSSEPENHEAWNQYFQRYALWLPTAQRPALFANFYLVEISKAGKQESFRLNPVTERLEVTQLPRNFDALSAELTRESADPEKLEREITDDPATKADNIPGQLPHDPLFGWQFEQSIPALVRPLMHNDVVEDRRENGITHPRDKDADDVEPVHWIVIELDPKVLRQQVLPKISQHYFGGPQGSNYDVAVVVGRTDQVLYTSNPDFLQQPFASPDIVLDIFGPPSNGRPALSHDFAGDFHAGGVKSPTAREEDRNITAPSWLPVLADVGHQPHWNLIIRHRHGSIESQMTALRRRDLAVSLGVLLLLGAAMTMLIIATRRAQRLAQQQMNFVATVSHELRTPLAVICSAADNLSDGVVNSQQQLQRYGETIKIQGRQLIALVEQILLFAATREGRQVYHLELLDVRRIVEIVLNNTEGLLEVSGVQLEHEIEADLPPLVADLAAVTQCVQNLVINAVKYGGDAKWIRVTARQFASTSKREIQISVEDRGIGMNAIELGRIFEPFYRSPQVAAAQIRGTGLGLPLAKSLAEAMEGELSVESTPGKGSTFTLHLPFADDSPLRVGVNKVDVVTTA